MENKTKENKTFKNIHRVIKKFEIGSLVNHRQLQVSTGKGSDYEPKFTGPYVIIKLNPDESSAIIEHLKNGNQIKAHFTNLQKFIFTPRRMPLTSKFIAQILDNMEPKPKKDKKKNSNLDNKE